MSARRETVECKPFKLNGEVVPAQTWATGDLPSR
jgi:hypothetical protein